MSVAAPVVLPEADREALRALLRRHGPVLALAPMQDITDWGFWNLLRDYGGADVYFTEYFRVTPDSRLDRDILRSVTENPTGRPVIAQIIGNDIHEMVRTALELQKFPVAGVDLNLGCPAPVVFKKCAGGGLLRDLPRVDALIGALREVITEVPFTIKTRTGFDDPAGFDELLAVFLRHRPDLVTVHGRTVADMYRTGVRYDLIAKAVEALPCPVIANGNIDSPHAALEVLRTTGAHGLMIGRGAVRNPWLFRQIRQALSGDPVSLPTGRQVHVYLQALFDAVTDPMATETARVHRVKKHVNFIGVGIEPGGQFLHHIRRCTTRHDFLRICAEFLDHDEPMPLHSGAHQP